MYKYHHRYLITQVDARHFRILDAIRETNINAKFYQASTSELFGKKGESPQSEKTFFIQGLLMV